MAYTILDAMRDAESVRDYMRNFYKECPSNTPHHVLDDYRRVKYAAERLYNELEILSEDYGIEEG